MTEELDYIVLTLEHERDAGASKGSIGDWPLSTQSNETLVSKTPKRRSRITSVGKTTMNTRQAEDFRRDPNSLLALNMPLSLIEPASLAEDGLNGTGGAVNGADRRAWGIREVLGGRPADVSGAGVKIAVLDTGIDFSHAAFEGVTIVPRNFTSPDAADIADRVGHGTHCAGTIFGRDVDGKRIGIARGVTQVLVARVLDNRGLGSSFTLLEALKWVHGEGANIVSMSLGFDYSKLQEQLIERGNPSRIATSKALKAYRENIAVFRTLTDFLLTETADRRGMVIVAAAGNDSRRNDSPDFVIDVSVPAAASPSIISVGATRLSGSSHHVAPFSNINPDLCAPGVDILSAAVGGGLRVDSGTSMACPHVAGIAALWWEWAERQIGRASGSIVRAQLIASSDASIASNMDIIERGVGVVRAPQLQ